VKRSLSFTGRILKALQVLQSKGNSFQSIFFHIPLEQGLQASNCSFNSCATFWNAIYDILNDKGVLWCCVNNTPTPYGLDTFPLDLAVKLQDVGFHTRNIILWYNLEYASCSNFFENRYTNIIFLTKDAKEYKFDIDKVREPHIWKEYEWGGGRRSRYHPLGKNPSNFWLKIESKEGKILNHIPMTWGEMVGRCLQSSTERDDNVLGIVPVNRDFAAICREQGLSFELVQIPTESFNALSKSTSLPSIKSPKQILQAKGTTVNTPRIYFKSSENMNELKDGEIHVAVTSPPYWGLRDYGVENQIGYNESYSKYLMRLETVWGECYRVLHDTGTLWININKRLIDGKILLFPADVIKSCIRIGFKLQDIIIWFRAISVPGTGQRNFTDRYEFIMMFSKKDTFRFYQNRLGKKRDFLNEKKGALINIWKLYRKIGNLSEEFGAKTKLAIKHTAMFPEELVNRVVLISSDEGDNVLDPFLGSGTTIAAAKKLGRNAVGYEINEAFKLIVQAKTRSTEQSILSFLNDRETLP
jgi:DNA modification methylase